MAADTKHVGPPDTKRVARTARCVAPTALALALALTLASPASAQGRRAGVTLVPDASDGDAGLTAAGVSTLTIDTRNTGVDLGLHRNENGSISTRLPADSGGARRVTLDSGSAAAGNASTSTSASTSNANDLGGANDASSNGPPGTSVLGNPTSAGRVNGNSGTNNGRSRPSSSAGTTLGNSGVSGNGLDGNTGAGSAANGNTGAGPAATGNTGGGNGSAGSAGAGSIDRTTAAGALAQSRQNRTTVSGRILTAPSAVAPGPTTAGSGAGGSR